MVYKYDIDYAKSVCLSVLGYCRNKMADTLEEDLYGITPR